MSTPHELGPLPEPDHPFDSDDCTYACPEGFSADQMRAYALAEVARAVEAERAQHQATLALQQRSYEREIELEVEAERERCASAVPSTWLDSLLTGPQSVVPAGTDCRVIEALLQAVQARIREGAR